ncbi:methylthioribulose 1-phosphate dehydratase [Rheinheimera baltica]|uniref:methylthioribulose 1-phosphate dehydratase n=1 Tax=Rheinheimera baltica TaxID=67576 RepID=UPI00273ED8DF|nr:methylthioribulose 1-phosphate dehydratase [Rheinheimera baltica]MDP5142225.1 methylthioribulose 1-phosphate dehydratase [Rheinheimera baltica]MDP5189098.1 methylthioribulose 1-phosphate dehydratase [Rheinheimera baltica]
MNNTAQLHQLNPHAIALCALGRWIASRHWVPATGGNFSIRSGEHSALVTASGKDKGELSPQDLLPVSWQDGSLSCTGTPSAETALHARLYQLDPQIKAVLHTHSVQATVFSRIISEDSYLFQGYEMQKAISGNTTHTAACPLALFDNTQHIPELADKLSQRWQQQPLHWGLLVRGHGLYVWGRSLDEAKRHLEGWEFLINCELERLKLTR